MFGRNRADMTSLNLQTPAKPRTEGSAPSSDALQERMQKTANAARESGASEEIGRRTTELLASGQKPQLILFLRDRSNRNPIALLTKEPPRNLLLLFSSVVLAHFYVKTRQLPAEITGLKLDEIEPMAEDWKKHGFGGFILDLSPKAPVFNVIDMKGATAGTLTFLWAQGRTIRNWQAQMRLSEVYGKQNPSATSPETLQKQRAALEQLRDFGSFDIPFVHWMIALIAGMQGDEAGRLASTQTLESFGPAFVGKTERREGEDGVKAWAESLSMATVGLLAEYGMLRAPDGSPVPSILRVQTEDSAAQTS